VVTIGGGHGQAALVSSLARLDCDITAVVSVADDGGCSGRLREELGMAPPGDIRRCLVAMATVRELAARFDERLPGHDVARSAGNLVLAEIYARTGSLQRAIDWAASMLGCVGRVVPVAETPGVLHAYDQERGSLEGETAIERESARAIVVNVEGPERASPQATLAVAEADLVLIGPGSFVGSTLAALTTGDLADAVVRSPARKVLVSNLAREAEEIADGGDHERILRDHLVIKSEGGAVMLDVLAHEEGEPRAIHRSDGSCELRARLRRAAEATHDEELLTAALSHHFALGLSPRGARAADPASRLRFDEALASARRRVGLPA
jgi:uncharacterized cofD-like protein